MSEKIPPAATWFMTATALLAVIVGLWSVAATGLPLAELPAFLALTVLGALAHLYPIRSAHGKDATYVVANTFLFAAVMLLGVGWFSLLAFLVWVPMTVQRYLQRKEQWLLIPAANAGQSLLAGIASNLVLQGWNDLLSPTLLQIGSLLLVITGFVLVQTWWVGMVIHLYRRIPFRKLGVWNRDSLISDGLLLCLGAVLALLWQMHPALLVLVMAPVGFAYYMLRGVQLIRLGEVDGKTGLYNSRRFEEQFERELASAKLLHQSLSLVFLDLDFLRDVNNTYGHMAGDVVIVEVAHRIRASIRPQDTAARFGGEEFVLLLPGTETLEAHWIAERIRDAVAREPFDIGDGQKITCSLSGGIATFPLHGTTLSQLTTAADGALYYAKRQGRNRTHTASEVPPAEVAQAMERPVGQSVPAISETRPQPAPAQRERGAGPVPPDEPAHHEPKRRLIEPIFPVGIAALLVPFLVGEFRADLQLLIALSILGFATEYWKVDLLSNGRGSTSVSMGVAVTMAAAATLGTYAAICVNVVNFGAHVLQSKRRQPRTLLVNLAILVTSAVAASLPLVWVRGQYGEGNGWFFGAILAAGLLYFLVNGGLVSLMVSHKQGVPVARLWREHFGLSAPNFIFTAVCGGLMGSAYLTMGWLALPVFVLPLLIMRYTYQTHIAQSARAYETAEQGRRALEEAHRLQVASMEHLIEAVSTIIDARDASVSGHSVQVARYAVALAEELGLPAAEVAAIRQGALLHDLGKVGIPEVILHKPGKLSPDEWRIMKEHTSIGERILSRIPGLGRTAGMVGQHHEKYNGKGYPYGLSGDRITVGARIIALADAIDSMLSDRPYAKAKPLPWVIEEVERCTNEHFDPAVVAAFRRLLLRVPPEFFSNSAPTNSERTLTEVACAAQG